MNRREILMGLMSLPLIPKAEGKIPEKLQYVFLTINKPNRNNRIYDLKCAESIIKQKHFLGTIIYNPNEFELNLSAIGAISTDLHMRGDDLVGSVTILDTPVGRSLKDIPQNELYVSIFGTGQIDDRGVVSDYTPSGFHIGKITDEENK